MNKYKYTLGLFILLFTNVYGQDKFSLIDKNVKAEFNLIVNSKEEIIEKIKVYNLSTEAIYIPKIEKSEIYFFALEKNLHSYIGIMNSMLGAPNLGGLVELIEIKPDNFFEFEITIKTTDYINKYIYSIDYVKGKNKKNIIHEGDKSLMKVIDYVERNQYIYSKEE